VGEGAYMTNKEVHRAEIFARMDCKQMTRVQAAEELKLSLRQIIRLYKEYKKCGRDALRSKRRGKPGNHRVPAETRGQVADLVSRELYQGFRPKFMREKLLEIHNINLSRETVRQIMIEVGVWNPNGKKRPVAHQQRKRRARYGELVQIDGSPHKWFEDRGERCTLLVYIDDATGRTFGKFAQVESTEAYMDITREYIKRFGIPRSFYSDKHGVFRVNREGCLKEELITQFGRATRELGIELICANSPQAKGRVERANRTLQDRLVHDLRIEGVKTIEEANKFLESTRYWEKHNDRFSVQAISGENVHKQSPSNSVLDNILCIKYARKISKNFELQYNNVIYQICPEYQVKSLRYAHVTVLEKTDGTINIEHDGKKLGFRKYCQQDYIGQEMTSKEIERFLTERKPRVVPLDHPWKRKRNYSRAV
jgi:hypothetical protein